MTRIRLSTQRRWRVAGINLDLEPERMQPAAGDYADTIRLPTRQQPGGFELPVDVLEAPLRNPLEYFPHGLEAGTPIAGPLSPAVSRIGQQIVDTAWRSAQEKRALPLLE